MTMVKQRLGILISGRGSNMQAIIEACEKRLIHAEVALVISNNPEAKGLDFCIQKGIHHLVINHKDYATKKDFEASISRGLKTAGVDLICLAGFMRLLSADFVHEWEGKIINIHPSLLPHFKGLDAQEQAIKAGASETGCTVHYVTAEMDGGPMIAQEKLAILPHDTVESLSARLLTLEHQCYVKALQLITSGLVKMENGVVKDQRQG